MTDANEKMNGSTPPPAANDAPEEAQQQQMDPYMAAALMPLIKAVFGDVKEMSIKRAIADSRFRHMLLFDLYARVINLERGVGAVHNILNSAVTAPASPETRIARV